MSIVSRSALVSHSAQQMFALVSEIESYPKFLPWCDRARVSERVQNRTVATLRINFRGLKEEFTTANDDWPNERIDMKLVSGDQADAAATPVTATPPATARAAAPAAAPRTPSAANASAANGNSPLSLSPQAAQPAAEPPTRVAATNPAQTAPSSGGSGGYLVQVSSQRSEADAQTSYKALQGKFPAVLGSRAPLIKRADLGEKGVYYRAMVGPFGSPDEASQFCGSLKSAGGQCVVQRN